MIEKKLYGPLEMEYFFLFFVISITVLSDGRPGNGA